MGKDYNPHFIQSCIECEKQNFERLEYYYEQFKDRNRIVVNSIVSAIKNCIDENQFAMYIDSIETSSISEHLIDNTGVTTNIIIKTDTGIEVSLLYSMGNIMLNTEVEINYLVETQSSLEITLKNILCKYV